MYGLPLIHPQSRSTKKGPNYRPVFTRPQQMALCKKVMQAKSPEEAARAIEGDALPLPDRGFHSWRQSFLRLADGLRTGRPPFSIFAMTGNVKLPFVAFSTLPLFTCPGFGECADYCYSLGGWRNAGSFCRQMQNTLWMRFRKEDIGTAFLGLPEGRTVRLYVDGDFQDHATFRFWMQLLTMRSDLKAYSYSKAWQVIWECVQSGTPVPSNYVLNLSSGGRKQKVSAAELLELPFVRGWFRAVVVNYRPKDKPNGNIGLSRYQDPKYHRAVRKAAPGALSCPGFCGTCHACGDISLKGLVIANGIH